MREVTAARGGAPNTTEVYATRGADHETPAARREVRTHGISRKKRKMTQHVVWGEPGRALNSQGFIAASISQRERLADEKI